MEKACDDRILGLSGCYDLGYLYYYGKGVRQNSQKAAALWKEVCDYGFLIGACINLGVLYEEGKV
ncbi:hypothetical protein [Campylobacter lanienae]|uniref:hypothetical protein n=1 Tax=Campylobacter lanienae TaxID=75658 RepID=UPI001F232FE1|nr:hypothetical protein [Campylobacter lanienae]